MKHCLAVEYSFYIVKMVQLYMWLALTFAKSCLLYAGIMLDASIMLKIMLA